MFKVVANALAAIAGRFGSVPASVASQMTDDRERPESMRGVTGGAMRRAGAEYEHARRLQAHPARMASHRAAMTVGPVYTACGCWTDVMSTPTVKVEAADDSPESESYAEHIRQSLGIGARSPIGSKWGRTKSELLAVALLGFGVWEMVPREVDGVWYTPLAVRDQASIDSWLTGPDDTLVGCVQRAVGSWQSAVIPASQMLHIAWRAVAPTDFSGMGFLRPMDSLADDYRILSQLRMVAAQRFAVGTPVGKPNALAAQTSPTDFKAQSDSLDTILSEYAASDRAHITLPIGFDLDKFGGDIDLSLIDAAIDATGRRALEIVLMQWLMLGSGSGGGSYALGEMMGEKSNQSAQGAWDVLLEALTEGYIPRAIRWQFGDVDPAKLPSFRADGLKSKAFARPDTLAALPGLVAAGMVGWTQADEDSLRSELEMEERGNGPTVRIGARNVGAPPPPARKVAA